MALFLKDALDAAFFDVLAGVLGVECCLRLGVPARGVEAGLGASDSDSDASLSRLAILCSDVGVLPFLRGIPGSLGISTTEREREQQLSCSNAAQMLTQKGQYGDAFEIPAAWRAGARIHHGECMIRTRTSSKCLSWCFSRMSFMTFALLPRGDEAGLVLFRLIVTQQAQGNLKDASNRSGALIVSGGARREPGDATRCISEQTVLGTLTDRRETSLRWCRQQGSKTIKTSPSIHCVNN